MSAYTILVVKKDLNLSRTLPSILEVDSKAIMDIGIAYMSLATVAKTKNLGPFIFYH